MDDPPELLTVDEVAAHLRVNPQTIRNWIDAGKLPHVKIGPRRVRIFRRDLEALIEAGETLRRQPPEPQRTGAMFWSGELPADVDEP